MIEESIARSNDDKAKVDQVAMAIRAITGERIEQIAKAIAQMEHVTGQKAATAEESASAAAELNAQSESLQGIAYRLAAMVG